MANFGTNEQGRIEREVLDLTIVLMRFGVARLTHLAATGFDLYLDHDNRQEGGR